MKKIDLSVIVPVYNVEKYLPECIDSLLSQNGINIEIIMIDDGSTDQSGEIAEQYVHKFRMGGVIKVVHRVNMGVSSARNTGLKMAEGEYVIFIDSDDRVKENSLCELYCIAIEQKADIVKGNVLDWYQDSIPKNPHNPVPENIKRTILSGSDAYIGLIRSGAYHPGAYCYLFKRTYLDQLQIRFDESIGYDEDELFTSLALCQAGRVFITGLEFYFYRQWGGSAVYSMSYQRRVNSLMYVAGCLLKFADRFQFSGNNGELKSWLYVKIFKIYFHAFNFLQHIKDTSFILPEFKMDLFWRNCTSLSPDAQLICREHYLNALMGINNYIRWRLSYWVMSVSNQYTGNEKLLLIYNKMMDEELSEIKKDIPARWIITTDRKYFSQADSVVFYIPHLNIETGEDIEKREGQIWVAWYPEAKENYSWLLEDDSKELFDIRMTYKQEADIIIPHYQYEIFERFSPQVCVERKQNRVCMFLSDQYSENGQKEYLKELMKYTEIDSFGSFCNNKQLSENIGKEKDIYRNYKFVVAFENFEDSNYVTEKFFDPILSYSVPIYLGAPNIYDFAPGNDCFVDVRQFENPKALADFINLCYQDDLLYSKFFEWNNKPFLLSFQQKIDEQKTHPFIRLLRKLDEKMVNVNVQ